MEEMKKHHLEEDIQRFERELKKNMEQLNQLRDKKDKLNKNEQNEKKH